MIYGSDVLSIMLSYRAVEGRVPLVMGTAVLIAAIRGDGVISVIMDVISPSFQVGD